MANDDEMTRDVDSLTSMAKRLGLKGRQLTQYVTEHMEKLGYVAKTHTTYERKASTSGGGRGGGFLGGLFGDTSSTSDSDDD